MIELEGITRVYRTGTVSVDALKGIDLTVGEGEFAAIMGSSGSGKSTLMNIIGCLDRPTEGSYRLAGEDVSKFGRDRLAGVRNRTIGFVFQNFHLLPRTSAVENVELPLIYAESEPSWKEIRERAREALATVGLADRMDHTPAELSGGQQQRVAIARALVTRPRLLLADEPTGNLDSRTSLEIIDMLQGLNREGLTILMVTHEPDIAAAARRTVVLKDGLVRSDRPTEQVLAGTILERLTDEDATLEDEDASPGDGDALHEDEARLEDDRRGAEAAERTDAMPGARR
jgi:putative ABC transport system ATP-binding protein